MRSHSRRRDRHTGVWMVLATAFFASAGIDAYLALTMKGPWLAVGAAMALSAAAGCLIIATRERRRTTHRIHSTDG